MRFHFAGHVASQIKMDNLTSIIALFKLRFNHLKTQQHTYLVLGMSYVLRKRKQFRKIDDV